jgi:hypothetical protein
MSKATAVCRNKNCPCNDPDSAFFMLLAEASAAKDAHENAKARKDSSAMASAARKYESVAMMGMWGGLWNPAMAGLAKALKKHPPEYKPAYMLNRNAGEAA